MSNFRVDGLCFCCQCQWNAKGKCWEGNVQPTSDGRTFPWMLQHPVECANCKQQLTTTVIDTPVAGTIPGGPALCLPTGAAKMRVRMEQQFEAEERSKWIKYVESEKKEDKDE